MRHLCSSPFPLPRKLKNLSELLSFELRPDLTCKRSDLTSLKFSVILKRHHGDFCNRHWTWFERIKSSCHGKRNSETFQGKLITNRTRILIWFRDLQPFSVKMSFCYLFLILKLSPLSFHFRLRLSGSTLPSNIGDCKFLSESNPNRSHVTKESPDATL